MLISGMSTKRENAFKLMLHVYLPGAAHTAHSAPGRDGACSAGAPSAIGQCGAGQPFKAARCADPGKG